MTHITYKTAKRLKEFLGESAPEPMDNMYYYDGLREQINKGKKTGDMNGVYYSVGPAYRLEDLLSKPFCEAFIKERFAQGLNHESAAWELTGYLERMINEYYNGGLPAVEAALEEMMK